MPIDNHYTGIQRITVEFMQKEIADMWECSITTVRRRVREYRLEPVRFSRGNVPLFAEKDIKRVGKKVFAKKYRKWRGHR